MQQQQRQQQQEAAAAEAAVQDAYMCVIDLAMYLPLGQAVSTANVRHDLPVPHALVERYGCVATFSGL
jgi:hypothetical protein